jgi:hypothetical protein
MSTGTKQLRVRKTDGLWTAGLSFLRYLLLNLPPSVLIRVHPWLKVRSKLKITKRTHFEICRSPLHQQFTIKPYQTLKRNEPIFYSILDSEPFPSCQPIPTLAAETHLGPFSADLAKEDGFKLPVVPDRAQSCLKKKYFRLSAALARHRTSKPQHL